MPRQPRKKVIRFEKIGGMRHALYTDRKMPKGRRYVFNIDIFKGFGIRRK